MIYRHLSGSSQKPPIAPDRIIVTIVETKKGVRGHVKKTAVKSEPDYTKLLDVWMLQRGFIK